MATQATHGGDEPVLRFSGVSLVRDGHRILDDIEWEIRPGQRWAVLGPNGAGKSSLLRLASTYEAASRGRCEILGHRIGRVDVRELRRSIGYLSPTLGRAIGARMRVVDVVLTGSDARLLRWREQYTAADERRAAALLADVGCSHLASAMFETLSEGERQRVLVARALMPAPDLLLFDEPTAGLDVLGREQFVATLGDIARSDAARGIAFVTHHPEEIPPELTHVLLLRAARVVAAGPIESALTSESLSECFGAPLVLGRQDGRYLVRLAT